MIKAILPVLCLLMANLAATHAEACSCMARPIDEDFAAADAVFVAKITRISELSTEPQTPFEGSTTSTQRATVDVTESFKGPIVQAVGFEAIFPVNDGTCGYPFYVGGTYLIWATGDSISGYEASAGSSFNGICGRTGAVENNFVQDELKWLRARD